MSSSGHAKRSGHISVFSFSRLVTEFERVNAFFQATEADPEEMHKELLARGKSLRGRFFDGQGRPLAITKVDFGGKFESKAAKYVSVQPNKLVAEAKVLEIKKRCLEFILEAVSRVDKRRFQKPECLTPR